MRIGILGAGSIGATLTRRLSQSGHVVKVANSRGPQSIDPGLLVFGATPVSALDVAADVDVLICSIPFASMTGVAPLLKNFPSGAVVIDTSNYYPSRDRRIKAIDDGQVESLWVSEMLGRPIAKAWNAITAESFASKATGPGTPQRIAIPIAADRERDRTVTLQLVDDTGFDAFDAGTLAESWRLQPAAPAYCTDLTSDQLSAVLPLTDKARLHRRRDLAMAVVAERTGGNANRPEGFGDWLVALNRAIYL